MDNTSPSESSLPAGNHITHFAAHIGAAAVSYQGFFSQSLDTWTDRFLLLLLAFKR